MSVGGMVTGRDILPSTKRIRIRTRDRLYPGDPETCVELADTDQAREIEIGDCFWWQSGFAYWTPMLADLDTTRGEEDTEIERVSYSYSVT